MHRVPRPLNCEKKERPWGLGRFLLQRCRGFGFFRNLRKARGVLNGNVCEDFAVERHTRSFEAVNQLTIGQPVESSRGADALNPQAAVLALLVAAIAESIAVGPI